MNVHKNARLTPQGRRLLVQRVNQKGWAVTMAAAAVAALAAPAAEDAAAVTLAD